MHKVLSFVKSIYDVNVQVAIDLIFSFDKSRERVACRISELKSKPVCKDLKQKSFVHMNTVTVMVWE